MTQTTAEALEAAFPGEIPDEVHGILPPSLDEEADDVGEDMLLANGLDGEACVDDAEPRSPKSDLARG